MGAKSPSALSEMWPARRRRDDRHDSVVIGGPAPQLTLTDTVVTANRLTASEGVFSQGGGLYTADPFGGPPFPVTLTRTVIAGNKPDQCVGC